MEAGFIGFIYKNCLLDAEILVQPFGDAILTQEATPPRNDSSATQSSKAWEEKVASETFY